MISGELSSAKALSGYLTNLTHLSQTEENSIITKSVNKAKEEISVPTKTSQLTNDSGFLTSQSISSKVGYAEYINGYLNLYSDSTKTKLISSVLIGNSITEEKCREIIVGYGYVTSTTLSNNLTSKVDKIDGYSLVKDTEIERLKNVQNFNDSDLKEENRLLKERIKSLEDWKDSILNNGNIVIT